MSQRYYDITFYGKTLDGFDLESVKQGLAKIFKTDLTRIEKMFSGKRFIIKAKLDELNAKKYFSALKKVGVDCKVEEHGKTNNNVQKKRSKQNNDVPKTINTSHLTAIPNTGSDLVETPPEATSPQLDLSAYTIATAGSDLNDNKLEEPPADVKTDHLALAPEGGLLIEAKEEAPPPLPDTSKLSIKPSYQ